MTFQNFMDHWNGVGCDFDGWYGDQCVDLFNQYNQDVIGAGRLFTPDTGGAADLWNDFAGPGNSAYRKIENTPDGVPQSGDVIIWAANTSVTGPAGHVAIATASCDVNSIYSFDQNYPTGSLPHVQHHPNYTGVYGWLRPLQNDAPVPEPVPEPAPGPASQPKQTVPAPEQPVDTPEPTKPATEPTIAPERKEEVKMTEGMKTSEFKAAFVAALTAFGSAVTGQISWGQALMALVALVIAYTTSRTVVKVNGS